MSSVVGNATRVTKDRAGDPVLSENEILVLTSVGGCDDAPEYTCAIFPADALELATKAARGLLAEKEGFPASHPIRVEGDAARAQASNEFAKPRASFFSCCKGHAAFLSVPNSVLPEMSPIVLPTLLPSVVGRFVKNLPVVDSSVSPPVVMIIARGEVSDDGSEYGVLQVEYDGKLYDCPDFMVHPYLAPDIDPVDISPATALLLPILKRMPASSAPEYAAHEASSAEMVLLSTTCGSPSYITGIVGSSDVGSPKFGMAVSMLVSELSSRCEGKILGSTWPTEPAALGKALRDRAASGMAPPEVERAPQVEPARLPPRSSQSSVEHPLSNALRSRCTSATEWDAFLNDSLTITVKDAPRHVSLRGHEFRMMGALERFFRSLSLTVEQIKVGACGLDADHLMDALQNFEEQSTTTRVGTSAVESAPSVTPPFSGTLDNTGTEEERTAKAALRDAARTLDAAAWERLREMQKMSTAMDYVGLENLKIKEKDENVLLLLSSAVTDVTSALQGAISDGYSNILYGVRTGFDLRLRSTLFPGMELASHQKTAIHRARVGKLSALSLLSLVGISDPKWSADSPLAGFDLLGSAAVDHFVSAMMLLQQVVALVSHHQTSESMQFFRTLSNLVKDFVERGASWNLITLFYKPLLRLMQQPATNFTMGLGGGVVLINLDARLLEWGTEYRSTFEQRLNAELIAAAVSKMKPVVQKTPSSPASKTAASDKDARKAYQAACTTCRTNIGKKDWNGTKDVTPCFDFFVKGSCSNGATCTYHHVGTKGSCKPAP